jgi:hypothetical protein
LCAPHRCSQLLTFASLRSIALRSLCCCYVRSSCVILSCSIRLIVGQSGEFLLALTTPAASPRHKVEIKGRTHNPLELWLLSESVDCGIERGSLCTPCLPPPPLDRQPPSTSRLSRGDNHCMGKFHISLSYATPPSPLPGTGCPFHSSPSKSSGALSTRNLLPLRTGMWFSHSCGDRVKTLVRFFVEIGNCCCIERERESSLH